MSCAVFDFITIWLRLFLQIMIFVVIYIISCLKPLHILLLFSVYIIIIMILIIFKIHASSCVVDLILYDTVMSNERLKGTDVVLIIVYPFSGKYTMEFATINSLLTFWLEDKTIYLINDTGH